MSLPSPHSLQIIPSIRIRNYAKPYKEGILHTVKPRGRPVRPFATKADSLGLSALFLLRGTQHHLPAPPPNHLSQSLFKALSTSCCRLMSTLLELGKVLTPLEICSFMLNFLMVELLTASGRYFYGGDGVKAKWPHS